MQADDGKWTNLQGVLLTVVAIALAGTAGMIGMLREVSDLGPRVGDIVSFDPTGRFSGEMKAHITAVPVNAKTADVCEMDVPSMYAGGGSVVIEAREPENPLAYRVHWAGTRTSAGGPDCGSSADLLLSEADISTLAIAAGGYGATAKTLTTSALWRSQGAAQ